MLWSALAPDRTGTACQRFGAAGASSRLEKAEASPDLSGQAFRTPKLAFPARLRSCPDANAAAGLGPRNLVPSGRAALRFARQLEDGDLGRGADAHGHSDGPYPSIDV